MIKRKTKKIVLMLICCLLVTSLTSGCKPKKKNNKTTYSSSKKKIFVNMLTSEVTLTNVRLYDSLTGKQKTISGKILVHSGWYNGSTEVTFSHKGNTYVVKVKISGDQVKVNYKNGNYYDTYKK